MSNRKVDRMVMVKGAYTPEVNKMIKLGKSKKTQFTKEMTLFASNFLRDNFDMELNIPIIIDGRLTSSGGLFKYQRSFLGNTPIEIKMSERFIACALLDESTEGIETILDVLKHELVHYALCAKGIPHSDGTPEFEGKLAELGIGASGATGASKVIVKKKHVWYKLLDVYEDPITGRTYKMKHTAKHQSWSGKRVGYEIVKTYWEI